LIHFYFWNGFLSKFNF